MSAAIASSSTPSKDQETSIRLRRLNSTTSSTYSRTTLPPYTSTTSLTNFTNPFLSPEDDASSTFSESLLPNYLNTTFIPTSSLQIQAQGKKAISLPTPSKELEIPIYEGGAGGELKYLSLRPERRSGNCILVRAGDESQTPVANTIYFFGPGHPPKMRICNPNSTDEGINRDDLEEEITLECKSLLSRAVFFESKKWGKFEWRYGRREERNRYSNPAPNNILLLEKILGGDGGNGKEERRVVARLVRSEETRTKGTKGSSAGNGGLLEMCLGGGNDFGEEGKGGRFVEEVIDELTVLTSCLVMLKKEIDRLRGIQMMVIAGGAGS